MSKDVSGNFVSIPAPEDNWKHRGGNMRCATCMWFVAKAKMPSIAEVIIDVVTNTAPNVSHGLGCCRRHAPTMNGFPAVFYSDWCGDHKLDENKL